MALLQCWFALHDAGEIVWHMYVVSYSEQWRLPATMLVQGGWHLPYRHIPGPMLHNKTLIISLLNAPAAASLVVEVPRPQEDEPAVALLLQRRCHGAHCCVRFLAEEKTQVETEPTMKR